MIQFTIFILVLLREGFYLLPENWIVLPGIVRMRDIGIILMIFVMIVLVMLDSKRLAAMKSKFSPIVISFLFLAILGSLVSYTYYGQPILEGLRASRYNFVYILFFFLLMVVDSQEKLDSFLHWFIGIAVVLTVLTVLQIAFPNWTIFHWEQFFKKRFGLYRWLNPGFNIVVLSVFLLMGDLIFNPIWNRVKEIIIAIFFALQVVLNQTRAALIGFFLATTIVLAYTRKIKLLIVVILCGVVVGSSLLMIYFISYNEDVFSNSLIINLLRSSYVDISKNRGHVAIRVEQAKQYVRLGMDHPITGTGVISPIGKTAYKIRYPAQRTDLGYIVLFSEYGLLGILWVVWFGAVFLIEAIRLFRRVQLPKNKGIVFALTGNFIYMLITFITLPHFTTSNGICIVAVNVALLEIIKRVEYSKMNAAESKELL